MTVVPDWRNLDMPLSHFARGPAPVRPDPASRWKAGLFTAVLYGICAALILRLSVAPLVRPAAPQIVTAMITAQPKKPVALPEPPVPDKIRARAERPAPPVITIATGAPPQAPAPLPATTALPSPMMGGTSGNGPMGQAASGSGGNGNGGAAGGCLDPVWMRAVSERVRQFFTYPPAALTSRTTGVAMVRFGVRRDGRIDKLEIGKSSGDAGLDKAAIEILQRAQPLPPIPDRMQTERVEGELPVNFGVRSFNAQANAGNC